MKLIYIANGNVSVFDSQVVALLNHYINIGKIDEIILILGRDYRTTLDIKKIKNLHKNIDVKFYKHYPQYFLIEKLTISSISKALKEIDQVENYIVHVRNDVLAHYTYKAFLRLKLDTSRIIADVRGAGYEQLTEFSDKNKFILMLKKVQRNEVNASLGKIKNISVVSESLKEYVFEKVGKHINVFVNSCLSNQNFEFNHAEREKTRNKLGVKNSENLLVLSTGGDNAWQNTRKTIAFLVEKNFKILNLSRTEIQHNNVINKFVPYEDMFKYLCAADAAIIWRNEGVTNKVASPVKFSEYVSCGLPVITNDSIDLITDYVRLHKCGEVLETLSSIDNIMVNNLKKLDRNEISIQGREIFGIDTIARQYNEFYGSTINSK